MTSCPACRVELPDEARFCGACGFRLAEAPPYAESGAEPAPVLLTRPKRPEPVRSGGTAARDTTPVARPARGTGPAPVLRPGKPGTAEVQIRALEDEGAGAAGAAGRGREREREQRRKQQRFALVAEVTLGSEHNFYQGFSENISEGGLFVATADLHPPGTRFDVTFHVPELGRSCSARAEVRWVREHGAAKELPAGMGLRFLDLSEADARAIEAFTRHREPLFFDD